MKKHIKNIIYSKNEIEIKLCMSTNYRPSSGENFKSESSPFSKDSKFVKNATEINSEEKSPFAAAYALRAPAADANIINKIENEKSTEAEKCVKKGKFETKAKSPSPNKLGLLTIILPNKVIDCKEFFKNIPWI